jgi:excisionase family DNA binding protein
VALSRSPDVSREEPVVLTVPQAAKLLQVSENHLYSLIAQNAVPHVRLGKLIRIPRWGLLEYIANVSGARLPVAIPSATSVHVERPDGQEA